VHIEVIVLVLGAASNMRQRPERKYESLKDVMIFGFGSAKSMVELTRNILENATSLESTLPHKRFLGAGEIAFLGADVAPAPAFRS